MTVSVLATSPHPALRRLLRGFLFAALLAGAPSALAQTLLYATAIRMHYEDGAARIECNLYRVDPATGASILMAPVRIAGREPIAVVSLAIHPTTGVVYGVTAGLSSTIPRSLVSIDPATGDVTLIGALGEVASDLAFSRDGTLYAWLPTRNRLARVDLASGHAAPREDSGIAGLMGGGMAIDDHDVAYVAATGATGTLDTVDIHTGRGTPGPMLEGAPYLSAITNLTFSPDGKLYAVNSNMGAPASTALVEIDVHNGKVTEIGHLPNDAHALIFGPGSATRAFPTALVAGVAALLLVPAATAWYLWRRRRRR
ncbi:MAG TPA: hypothetical protein VFE23_05345 [Usitatibacter sp.]|jgi:hypothetical protein|nr:hypothetical protein [Usitatibacter sp.]